MKPKVLIVAALLMAGCAASPQQNYHAQQSYQEREEIKTSLFENDSSNISNEAAEEILKGRIALPSNARVGLLKLPSNSLGVRYYGYDYWRSESYIDLQQQYVDVLTSNLLAATQIKNVVVLPSFMVGDNMSLSQMREAAVRMQAHILVIYNINSNIFQEYRIFRANRVKAFSTCEAALLDTITGVFPYTKVVTKKHLLEVIQSDSDMAETRKRAEIEASELCLHDLGGSISEYMNTMQVDR